MSDLQTTPADFVVNFATSPVQYKHWQLQIDGGVAQLSLDVQENQPLVPGYDLKLNSYDLGVDIELYDAVQRLRFEHPEVGAVVITSAKDRLFCAGANIKMLGQSDHGFKVNFCKFTNETRNAMEDASTHSSQTYICAINGPAAGGGYELALACDHILLIDDGSSTVSLPELPLLAVLPGTGGLTRLVDKRKIRHDHADFLCTTSEGVRGRRALDWKLVDQLAPRSSFEDTVKKTASEVAQKSDRPTSAQGIKLTPLKREIDVDQIRYEHINIHLDRNLGAAHIMIQGPAKLPPDDVSTINPMGDRFWPLALARQLDDAILHLRLNETEIGTWVFHTQGDGNMVAAYDNLLLENASDWLVREIILYLKRTLKRLDVSSRSLVTLIEPGSCFTGTLLELVLAADRSFMLDGLFEDQPESVSAFLQPTSMNFGQLPMVNGITRLEGRFLDQPASVEAIRETTETHLDAEAALELGLVTFIPDDIDWEDEVRLALEERASFSPDALSGMEANLRFGGPETMESKIFGRLSAWQNWIFQRPNASGDNGALQLYGTGAKTRFDKGRI
ncbi:MAG: 2,3-epoxybenzoyl-CoA dihydrolase [Dehalococcoidia bacterium]|nr:2,3-epoxybenzoyl-CoA dihydrolase [Dehalococcoidia bacterium]|tara:strand:- start:673 stop:2358 length:1686 start_codon:yes stop_codon:yes gene_type:complete